MVDEPIFIINVKARETVSFICFFYLKSPFRVPGMQTSVTKEWPLFEFLRFSWFLTRESQLETLESQELSDIAALQTTGTRRCRIRHRFMVSSPDEGIIILAT